MYKLKPAFSADAKVTPKQIVYKLPSYHPELGTHDSTDVEMTESDPVKVLEARQVQLIAALNAQAAKLNELFSKMGKPAKKESVQVSKKDASPVKENSQEKDLSKTPPKKDKDAKKEARKAAKVEAKSKVTGEKNPQHTDAPKARNVTPMEVSWVVYEDKKTIETGQSLTANLPSALLSAQQQKLGAISVVIAPEDKPWLERLSAIGSKRNVAFVGDVANSVKSAGTTVTVRSGNAFSLTDGKGLNVSSRITAWKLLGSALGIFTSEFTHAISSTHQHQWMVKAERVLSGSQKGDATYLEREASQFLSRFDSLSGLFDVSIADVIRFWGLKMPFMHGSMPLRRTFFYLQQGKIKFRDNVQVFAMGFHRIPNERQVGARDFVYWNWAQLQYYNPKVQLVKQKDKVITPFARAYLNDGREVLFDFEGMPREEIEKTLAETLGKTELVERREKLEKIAKLNPADFGSNCERQCMCEVQGQHTCTALLQAPKCMTGKWRWNHNLI